MEFNLDEFLTTLYAQNIKQKAEIIILRGLVLHLLCKGDKDKIEKMDTLFDSQLPTVLEALILDSPLKDEYLQKQANEFLQKIKDELK
jgi:hypothetical protein